MNKSRKVITVCSPQLGLSPNSHLGGEVYDVEIIDELCKRGLIVDVLLPKNRDYRLHKNLHIEHLPITHIVPPHLFNLFSLPYLFKKYNQTRFEILRIHSPFFVGIAGWIFKKSHPDVKVVTDILLREDRWDLKWIFTKTLKIYDHFFVLTDYLKKELVKEYGISPRRISVIYGGVGKFFKAEKKDTYLVRKYKLKDKLVLLNVGRLIERKNVLFLVDLLEKLSEEFPNLVLVYCGAGEQKGEIIETARIKGLSDKVIIFSPQHDVNLNKVYNLGDIFLFPTFNEGLGLVAAEAMICGKPVIASNNTSLPEVVLDKKTGYLAKTNDLEDWYKKTRKLLRNWTLRKRMSESAIKRAKKVFSWHMVGEKIYSKLKEI